MWVPLRTGPQNQSPRFPELLPRTCVGGPNKAFVAGGSEARAHPRAPPLRPARASLPSGAHAERARTPGRPSGEDGRVSVRIKALC